MCEKMFWAWIFPQRKSHAIFSNGCSVFFAIVIWSRPPNLQRTMTKKCRDHWTCHNHIYLSINEGCLYGVCVMLRTPKPQCPLPCSWSGWKALNECIKVVGLWTYSARVIWVLNSFFKQNQNSLLLGILEFGACSSYCWKGALCMRIFYGYRIINRFKIVKLVEIVNFE
jgi:hypothetical protein